MKIAEGVYLHFIKTEKFKTNHIKVRFTGKRDEKTLARRVLVAQMLESVNAVYKTQKAFRERLSELYGAQLSTQVNTRGLTHMVDVNLTFVKESFLLKGDSILGPSLDFLEAVLFHPLVSVAQYKPKQFDIEKENLVHLLEADQEDPYYAADLQLRQLYFKDPALQHSKYGSIDLIEKENSYTVYQEFQKMLQEDRIDIFVLGEVDEYLVLQKMNQFPFGERHLTLQFEVPQQTSKVTREKLEQTTLQQTILTLAYHIPVTYGTKDYFTLLVLNGLLGGFSHSKLFQVVREKEGLAYHIGSYYDISTQYLAIYAGITQSKRQRTLQLINQQLMALRLGRFSKTEIEQTKKMLQHQAVLAEDDPENMMELAFRRAIDGDRAFELNAWLEQIEQVTKKELMQLAQQISLQALYIKEGQNG